MVPKWTPDQDTRIRLIRDFINTSLKAKDEVYPEDFDAKAKWYAENLESFATAIGYTATNSSYSSGASENLTLMIKDLVLAQCIVPYIGQREESAHAFPKRADENIPFQTQELVSSSNEVTHAHPESIGDVNAKHIYVIEPCEQEPIDNTGTKRKGLDHRAFSYNSFVARGLQEGITMRAHASGSAPATLGVFRFLDASDGKQTRIENHFIRAGLIIAIYALGDYHTISETAAGICHYHQRESYTQGENDRIYTHEDISGNPTTNYLEEISPIVFQNIGIGHLSRITDQKSQDAFTALSQNLLTEIPTRQAKAPSLIATSNNEETSSYFTSSTFSSWIPSIHNLSLYNLFSRTQEPFNRPAYTL